MAANGFAFALCADDYGMTQGVSRGILDCALAGRISAASAMVNLPDWPRAAQAWTVAKPDADLGLHLNLTIGTPLTGFGSLASTGAFAGLIPLMGQAMRGLGRANIKAVQAEIEAQIDAFAAQAGRPPDHIDGHQHVHVLPGVRHALFGALAARGLGGIRIRNSADRPSRILRRGGAAAKALQVAALGAGFGRAARSRGFVINEGFSGFSDFDPLADCEPLFAGALTAHGTAHLVMCHPGYSDAELAGLDPVTQARDNELEYLCSDRFTALLFARHARLVRWSALSAVE